MKTKGFLFTTILIFALSVMLIACSGDGIGNKNGIASISFGEKGLSKSLSATIEGPSVSSLYWRYTAVNSDTYGPSSGRTGSGVTKSKVISGTVLSDR